MTEYSKKWSDAMKSSMISCFSASIALNTTVKNAQKYGLPATTISEDQCDKIMRPVYKTIL